MPAGQPYQPQPGHGQPEEDFYSWKMMAAALTGAPQGLQQQQQQQQQRGIPEMTVGSVGGISSVAIPPEIFQGVKIRGLPFSCTKRDIETFLVSGK